MKRRGILKGMLAAGAGIAGLRLPVAKAADYRDYDGKLFVSVHASGGWDPTSFCDPKANVAGEPVINHWAEEDDIRHAGGIAYAPFADNEAFFAKHHRRMLVINGVDAQTNSHDTGQRYNWSGRNSEGYPSLNALLTAHHAPDMPLAYLTFGGYSRTFGVGKVSRLGDGDVLDGIVNPLRYIDRTERTMLEDYAATRNERLDQVPDLLPGELRKRRDFKAALLSRDFEPLRTVLEDAGSDTGVPQQVRFSVLAFKAGLAVGADLVFRDFDTHGDHDAAQAAALSALTNGVDQLWDYAETHGVADRLVVVIGSDFGRTNYYNETNGKDHWPIGSVVVMEKNQPWTDRAVGETDPLHFARRVDPATLRRDDDNGAVIHPRHVHKALRRYLGVELSAGAQRFPFHNTEDFAFFG